MLNLLEDTGAYGRDINTDIVSLLRGIVEVLPEEGDVMLRVGMTNPPYILEHLEGIAGKLDFCRIIIIQSLICFLFFYFLFLFSICICKFSPS